MRDVNASTAGADVAARRGVEVACGSHPIDESTGSELPRLRLSKEGLSCF